MLLSYQQLADRAMRESCERRRGRLRDRHLAQRHYLYARAVATGDLRTALACLRDEAVMLGLYQPTAAELSVPTDQPVPVAFIEVASPSDADRDEATAVDRDRLPALPITTESILGSSTS